MENDTQQPGKKESPRKRTGRPWVKFVIALLVCYTIPVLGAVFLFIGPMIMPSNPLLGTGIGEIVLGMLTMLAVALLGGKKWLRFSSKGLKKAFSLSWPVLAGDAILVIWSIVRLAQAGASVQNMLPGLLGAFVYCLGIGIFEEMNFRGLLLNGLLAPLGKSRAWIMICVIATSLWFGRVHVGQIDMTDSAAVILAVLKIVLSGCFGVIMCAVVLHTRELFTAVLIHFLHDFMLMGTSVVSGGQAVANYTDTTNAAAGFIAYGILLAIILLPTIWSFRSILRGGKEDHGAFIPAD